MESLRVLVIDDTSSYRALLSGVLGEVPGVEVLGIAASAATGLARARARKPDLVLLDAGLADLRLQEFFDELRGLDDSIGVILVDTGPLTPDTTSLAASVAALGAVARPALQDEAGHLGLAKDLTRIIDGFHTRRLLRGTGTSRPTPTVSHRPPDSPPVDPPTARAKAAVGAAPPAAGKLLVPALPLAAIGIGISTGGPNALAALLPALPANLPVPILIVQHITDTFTASLVKSLDSKSQLHICEGEDGVAPVPGSVYLAPGGRHMMVGQKDRQPHLFLTDDPPVNHCKPAADCLFHSMADVYGARGLGVIMTGMGSDGAAGLVAMRAAGARVLAQDEATCMVYGMPGAAVRAGVVDVILPLQHLAAEITRLAMHGRARA